MKLASVLLAASLSLCSARARADAPEEYEPRSPRTGVVIGASATLLPLLIGYAASDGGSQKLDPPMRLLVIGGVSLGPALGLYYARQRVSATVGATARALLYGVAVATSSQQPAIAITLSSAALMSALVDVLRTPRAVEDENRESKKRVTGFALLPGVFSRGGAGLVAAGTF